MENKIITKELEDLKYRQRLILKALRNLLEQNNPNDVNGFLIKKIDKEIW